MSEAARGWRRLATILLVVAAVGFLAYTAATQWRELSRFDWSVRPALLVASIVAHTAVLAWGVFVWSIVVRHLSGSPQPTPFAQLVRIWAVSSAARYIPGGIWQFVAAAELARGTPLRGAAALASMLVHVGYSLLSAFTIGALALPAASFGVKSIPLALRLLPLAAAVLILHPRILNRIFALVPRRLLPDPLIWSARWVDALGVLVLAHISWVVYGLAYYLFVASLVPLPFSAIPPLIAVNALSFAAGYLVVLAPGGLGVRESAMTLMLAPLLPVGVAAVVAVGARLWSIAAELLLAASGIAGARTRARR